MLVYCKIIENHLKNILTSRSISGLHVELCILIFVHMLVLYIKLLTNAQM